VMTISTFMTFSFVTVVLRAEKCGADGGCVGGDSPRRGATRTRPLRSPQSESESDLDFDLCLQTAPGCNYR
jgi:hypothetical protein